MFGRRFARRFYQGEGFPWEQGEGPGFGPRGPWERGFGPGPEGHGPERRGPWQHPAFSPEMQALRSTAGEVARLFAIAGRNSIGNPEKQAQLRAYLEKSRKELLDIIGAPEPAEKNETPAE